MARRRESSLLVRVVVVSMVAIVGACGPKKANVSPAHKLASDDRMAAIRRAEVWLPTDVASMDIRTGPKEPGAFAPFAEIDCTYTPKALTGNSPKFVCLMGTDDELKVKYGRNNGEVYAEVAASRLLWALGFGADRMYPVKVRCHGCPTDPDKATKDPQPEVLFEPASVERKMPGTTLENKPDSGWSWVELDELPENAPPEMKAHRDALKLVAVMLQHSDSKPQQQRLICLPGSGEVTSAADCKQPFMMINDLGITFGKATLLNHNGPSSVNFENWSKEPVWKDAKACVGNLPASFTGTLDNPVISEAGRKFLADLLSQLTDVQLHDLFQVSRFDLRSESTIDDWVAVFKNKRTEISTATCPN